MVFCRQNLFYISFQNHMRRFDEMRFTADKKKVSIIDALSVVLEVPSERATGLLTRLKVKEPCLCQEFELVKLPNSQRKTPVANATLLLKILLSLPGNEARSKRLKMANSINFAFGEPANHHHFDERKHDEKSETRPGGQNRKMKKTKPTRQRPYVPMILRAKLWMEKYGDGPCKQTCSQCNFTQLNPFNFHVGHIVSLKNGGTWDGDNLLILCPGCNLSNGSGHQEDFKNLYFPEKMEKNTKILNKFLQSQTLVCV